MANDVQTSTIHLAVLWTAPDGLFGGYERFVTDLVERLPHLGMSVEIRRPFPWAMRLAFALTGELVANGRPVSARVPRLRPKRVVSVVYAKNDLLDLLLLRLLFRRTPSIIGLHSPASRPPGGKLRWIRRAVYSKLIYDRLVPRKDVWFHSLRSDSELAASDRMLPDKVRVIPNYVRPFQRAGHVLPRTIRPIPVVAFVGRLCYEKGFDLLVDAVGAVNSEGVCVECVVVGTGPLVSECIDRPNIKYLGFVSDPYPILESSDFVVMPSRWDQAPFVAREAASVGTPVIASDLRAFDSYVFDSRLRMQAGVVGSLEDALRQAIRIYGTAEYEEMRAQMRRIGDNEPTIDSSMELLASLIAEVANQSPQGDC